MAAAAAALMIVAAVAAALLGSVSGQDDCLAKGSSSLYPCFPYVQAGNETAVGSDCCVPLTAFVSQYPQCVCSLRQISSSIPNVNLTRAFLLNTLCSIPSNPAIPSCDAPAPAPAPAPASNADSAGSSYSNEATILSSLSQMVFIPFLLIWCLRK